jgi:hypothetical protein
MKQTFASKTFASKTFASGNWAGVGVMETLFQELFVSNYDRLASLYFSQTAYAAIQQMPFTVLGIDPAVITEFDVDEPTEFGRAVDADSDVYPRLESVVDAV